VSPANVPATAPKVKKIAKSPAAGHDLAVLTWSLPELAEFLSPMRH
jgi:hypothetical protein